MNHVADKLERVTCPFSPNHVVQRFRLHKHLVKCKKNLPPDHDFVPCPFTETHYVRKHQLTNHVESCDHRLRKEAAKIIWAACDGPSKFMQPKRIIDEGPRVLALGEESWENHLAPVFEPAKLLSKTPYMIQPQGLSKAKRKNFREQERERLKELEKVSVLVGKKNEKKDEDFDVLPRKPGSLLDRNSHCVDRIAAQFSSMDLTASDEGDSQRSTSSWVSSSIRPDLTTQETLPSVGRGRGILGLHVR